MISTPAKIFLIFIMTFSVFECFARDDFQVLWQKFYQESHRNSFDQSVTLYQVNSDLTKICFVYKRSVFIFENNQINQVHHAKILNTDAINRISSEKNQAGESFVLWSNDKRLLTIGS